MNAALLPGVKNYFKILEMPSSSLKASSSLLLHSKGLKAITKKKPLVHRGINFMTEYLEFPSIHRSFELFE